jgi:hypothetical protein
MSEPSSEVVRWRIYYPDSVWDSADGPWDDAPSDNVQIVMLYHEPEPYRTVMMGEDEFRLTPNSSVKYGKWMDDAEYEALVKIAMEDGYGA